MAMPSVLVFDVNETLSDMGPIAQRFVDLGKPPELARVWFASLLRDGFSLATVGTAAPFAELAGENLRILFDGSDNLDHDIAHVMEGFSELRVHPDVVEGIEALGALGLRLVTLSNGSAAVADKLLSGAGIRDRFEALLSVADAGIWKPAPRSYAYAAEVCGVEPAEMMLVAVHPWDTDGAARAGMASAWINRDGRPYPSYFTPPTNSATSLPDLAVQLGRAGA